LSFVLVIELLRCALNYDTISALFYCTVALEFLDFSRNRLAVHPLPPGDTSVCCAVLVLVMNRLAVMSFCPTVRHCHVRFNGFTAVLRGCDESSSSD